MPRRRGLRCGVIPTARDSVKPNPYMTTRRERRHQSINNGQPTGHQDIKSTSSYERSVTHVASNPPHEVNNPRYESSDPPYKRVPSETTSEMSSDRKGDGRTRKELESLDGRWGVENSTSTPSRPRG